MSDPVARSYDVVAERYAKEIADELPGKPVDRAWLNCLAELATDRTPNGVVADVGCGPGHIAAYLAGRGCRVVGLDISPRMIEVARQRYPQVTFEVGSMLDLPVHDGAWTGAACPYSIIHLEPAQRPVAFAELARVIVSGGWLLLSFHVSGEGKVAGDVKHVSFWWDHEVDLDFQFLDPDIVAAEVSSAGFTVMAMTIREPWPAIEAQTRRAHILTRRDS